jgi:hypothetical protein
MSVLENAETAQTRGSAIGVRCLVVELDAGLLFLHAGIKRCVRTRCATKRSQCQAVYETVNYHVQQLPLNKMERMRSMTKRAAETALLDFGFIC